MNTSVSPLSMRTGMLTTIARRGRASRCSTPGSMSMTSATPSSCLQAIWKVGELVKMASASGTATTGLEEARVGADTRTSLRREREAGHVQAALYENYTPSAAALPVGGAVQTPRLRIAAA